MDDLDNKERGRKMRFIIEGTEDIRTLTYTNLEGVELRPETIASDGTEISYDRKEDAYIISLRDFARWSRLINRIKRAENEMTRVINRVLCHKTSDAVAEIITDELHLSESAEELPAAMERVKQRLEDEIELPLHQRIGRKSK